MTKVGSVIDGNDRIFERYRPGNRMSQPKGSPSPTPLSLRS
jgi:hypothetical protein